MKRKLELASEYSLPHQPYIIICGKDIGSITKSYLIVGEVKFSFDNFMDAVALCFKLFHVLKLDYPVASCHICSFFQLAIFNLQKAVKKLVAKTKIALLQSNLNAIEILNN